MIIGLVGGMSWESTTQYYRLLNQQVKERFGGLHSARCVLYSVDLADIDALQRAGDWERCGELLADAARSVERAGAELLVLCTNTLHKVSEQIEAAVSIPLLDLRDVTARAVLAAGVRRVGLLGTAYTMEESFYVDRLAGHGLDVVIPGAADRAIIHSVIFNELVRGVVSEESRALYRGVMARLAADGCQGIILGCTEIELLVDASDSPVPVFPTTRLHVDAVVERAFASVAAGA